MSSQSPQCFVSFSWRSKIVFGKRDFDVRVAKCKTRLKEEKIAYRVFLEGGSSLRLVLVFVIVFLKRIDGSRV